jgi:glycosyltransferase involved in cell wall biosynthesis
VRVAIVNWSRRLVGGIEEYIAAVAPALRSAGHQVLLWHETDQPSDRERIELPTDVRVVGVAGRRAADAIDQLRGWRPDVIYLQGLTDIALAPALAEVAPCVMFVHTYTGTCISGAKTFTRPVVVPCERRFGWPCLVHYFPHGCGGRSPVTMWNQFRLESERLAAFVRCDAVITHTDHIRRELERHGVRAETVTFPVVSRIGRTARAAATCWRLVFAGRMESLKGGKHLLDALPAVAASIQRPIRMIFAGDGRDRAIWETHARTVQKRVPNLEIVFTGWLSLDRMADLLEDTDLLVVPSLWPEPFGAIGPKAGLHGVPAAAFAVGGIPQWLRDGVNGHLAPGVPDPSKLAEAIVRCLSDPDHYDRLRAGAIKVAASFNMPEHLVQLMKVFRRVIRAEPALAAGG